MSKQKRWSRIIESCKSRDHLSVDELVDILHVSPATVRRDLQQMEDLNMITRYHGGAKISGSQYDEPSMIIKSEANTAQKRQIAYLAAKQIRNNQMIYIDAGSTTYEMINYISVKNITVVTPGIPHLSILGKREIPTIVLGGAFRYSTEAVTGAQAAKQLEEMYFDIAFIGTNAIHEQIGFTTSNEMEAATKNMAIQRSKVSYILADSSKFNMLCPVKFANLDDAIILSDSIGDFDKEKIRYILTDGTTNI